VRLEPHFKNFLDLLIENICSIFIWRKPVSSQRYAIVTAPLYLLLHDLIPPQALFILFLTTLLLPTKYAIKLSVFVLGFIFWHVIPVIAVLAPSERRRYTPFSIMTET